MRTLIDTNILIALEDDHILESRFSDFVREASKNSDVLIHPASIKDIERDKNKKRKAKMISKLSKYQKLDKPPEPDPDFKSLIGDLKNLNDEVDATLLYAVHRNSVNFLVTEDKGIHRKAKIFGLHERVLNVNHALSLFEKLAYREIPEHTLIQAMPCHNLNIDDPFFDSLREDYNGKNFNKWFEKICQEGRDCWALHENDNLMALNIYKEERKVADSPEIPTPTLKLSTFKVSEMVVGKKIGELMIKLSFRYAVDNSLHSIYLTAYPKQESLINLLEDFGFHYIGLKGEEQIMMKLMTPPKDTKTKYSALQYAIDYYPHLKDGPSVNKFITPIRPVYHSRFHRVVVFLC